MPPGHQKPPCKAKLQPLKIAREASVLTTKATRLPAAYGLAGLSLELLERTIAAVTAPATKPPPSSKVVMSVP